MKTTNAWLLGAALALAAGGAAGQGATPLLRHSFDEDECGWMATGTNARATITQQTSFNGKGSLKFEYDIKPGVRSLLALNTPNGLPLEGKTLRLWVNSDRATALALLLQEKDGGRYTATFAAPRNRWQEVALSVADFALADGPNDPKDPDGKLDLDLVGNVALIDVVQMFGVADNPDIVKLLGAELGPRTLRLDDFLVTAEKLPPGMTTANGEVRIDTFARPQVSWVGIGGVSLTRFEGAAPDQRGLQAIYRPTTGRIVAMMKMMPRGKLQGMARLSLKASSTQATTLIVQLEEAGGGKFNTTVTVPEGGAWSTHTIELAELNAGDDSKVRDRKVKPELVTQLVVLDITGAMGGSSETDNVLQLTDLRAQAAK